MNFEPYDNANRDIAPPNLSTIMEIVERRQRRRYQVAGVGVMAGLAAAGAIMTDVFQRGGTTVENVETAGEITSSEPNGQASDQSATNDDAAGQDTSTTATTSPTTGAQEAAEESESQSEGDSGDGEDPADAGPGDSATAAETTTTAPPTTPPDETTTTIATTTEPAALVCPAPNGTLDDGAWIGRGLVRFEEAAMSEADAKTLASAWVIPVTEAQALLGLGADSGVNLLNDLGAIQIWDNWAADYEVGATLTAVASAWNSTSISVKALYLIGEPAAVAAVADCPPAT